MESRAGEGAERAEKPGALRAYWKDGLRFESADKDFKLKIGGRIMADWAFMSGDRDVKTAFGSLDDAAEFRRARLYVSGLLYDAVEFKAEYDFAGGDADFKDVFIGLPSLPVVGNVRVGHFKEPFGLEELTSSNYITFMERSLTSAFTPSRNMGLMLYDGAREERMTWAVGVFRDTDDFASGSGDGEYAFTGRLTGLAWYEDDGDKLLHLGVSASHRSAPDDTLRFRQRPETHPATRFVDTGAFSAENADLLGAELALVYGPFSLQSEYISAGVDRPGAADPDFSGYYIAAGWFLTGEHRPYKRSGATFGRIRPAENFRGEKHGPGAWEVAARFSSIDLDDAGIAGGKLEDVTVGLNWYINPNTRVMWNYVRADRESVGNADILQMRFQVDF